MKKLLVFSLILSTIALSSCGGHKTEEVSTSTDSTKIVVDSTACDTIKGCVSSEHTDTIVK